MGWSTDEYQDRFNKRPIKVVFRVLFIIAIGVFAFSMLGSTLGWFSEAETVAKDEFGPKASLKKYEWFKDCANTIEEKSNTIHLYESNIDDMHDIYGSTLRKDWDRLDKQQYNLWQAEITGIKASYNKIVKEYNSQSSKFNWSMYNTSDLPEKYNLYKDE